MRSQTGWLGVALTLMLLLGGVLAASSAVAVPLEIGGVDAESQYTGHLGGPPGAGVLTFMDASTTPGTVTTSDLASLISGRIMLEMILDTSAFDPATGFATNASFIGTGGNEITIWDSTLSSVLLSFDLDFINVTGVTFDFGGAPSSITLGNQAADQIGASSRMTISGGTLAGAAGGIGAEAVLEVFLPDPNPPVTFANFGGYWNTSFTSGIPTPPAKEIIWNITIVPEPGTTLLLGLGVVALRLLRRREER